MKLQVVQLVVAVYGVTGFSLEGKRYGNDTSVSTRGTSEKAIFDLDIAVIDTIKLRAKNGKSAIEGILERDSDALDSLIVGGVVAAKHAWPWMAALFWNGHQVCAGSVISDLYILTAAHCVQGKMSRPKAWTVLLGEHHLNTTDPHRESFGVDAIIGHKRYANSNNDIALMKLNAAITFNEYIGPVKVTKSDVPAGTMCVAMGWGDTEGTGPAMVLNQVDLPIISSATCGSAAYYGSSFNSDTMICAGYEQGGKDTCQGDSGGPLVCESGGTYSVVGITSWGYGCADPFSPGVYTRVVYFRNWLAENMMTNKKPKTKKQKQKNKS